MLAIIRFCHAQRFIPCVVLWNRETPVVQAIASATLDDRCVVAKRTFPRLVKNKDTPP